MSPYIASYFYSLDDSVRNSDFTIVPGIASISECLTTLLISYILKYIKLYYIIANIGVLSCICLILSSFIKNSVLFCWIFGISLGALSSTIFLPSIWILWDYIPTNKGKLSGLILAGYSLGPVPFGLMFIYLVNPNDESPSSINEEGDEKMFEHDVSDKVPSTIRIVTGVFLACFIIGLALLPIKSPENNNNQTNNTVDIPVLSFIKSLKFWNLTLLMYLTSSGVIYTVNVYKIIGLRYFSDDHLISYIGIGVFISMTLGRLIYGVLFDKFKLKNLMIMTYMSMSLILFFLWFSLNSEITYGIFIISFNFFGGSVYNGLLIQSEKDFPNNKKAISLICLTFIPIYFSGYFFEKLITPRIGYLYTFIIFASFYLISSVLFALHGCMNDVKVEPEAKYDGVPAYPSPTEAEQQNN